MAMLLEGLIKELALVDATRVFSSDTINRIERDLLQANLEVGGKEFLSFALVATAFASTAVFLSLLLFLQVSQAIFLLPLLAAITLVALIKYPAYRKRKRAELIEQELVIALRVLMLELKAGSFEKAVKSLATGYGELSKEFRKVAASLSAGTGFRQAMSDFAERIDSMTAKRVAAQLVFSYEQGFDASALRKLSDELTSIQKTHSKEFNARLSFLGLLFISASTIVPALFSAYVIVGSSFLATSISPTQVLLAFLVLFPLLDAAILFYLHEKQPRVLWGA